MPSISNRAFHEADGVQDWRVLYGGAHAFFGLDSYAQGAAFVAAVAAIADELQHFPDVDLRAEGVTVRTFSGDYGALSDRDAELARRVSLAAVELGLQADPSRVQAVQLAIAQVADQDVRPFWAAALGYDHLDDTDAIDPLRRNPNLTFQDIEPAKPGRGRMHVDVSIPADQVEARVAAALAAGGRIADDSYAPMWWTLASPENHGVDIAGWVDFKDD